MKGRKLLGMLSIALAITMAVVLYCDLRNPVMAFLMNNVTRIYILALCVCAAAEGVVLLVLCEKTQRRAERREARRKREEQAAQAAEYAPKRSGSGGETSAPR